MANSDSPAPTSVRVDKWLWATRFFKTRSQAGDACQGEKIKRKGKALKPSAAIKTGDQLQISKRGLIRDIEVRELIVKRVGAPKSLEVKIAGESLVNDGGAVGVFLVLFEIATGSHMDPWPNYTTQTTAYYIKHQAEALTELLPCLKAVKFMRSWAGLADMTPDMAPIIDGNDPIEGYYLDCGWGYFGFKSCAVTGKYVAQFMATGECPDILKPFSLNCKQVFSNWLYPCPSLSKIR